MPVLALIFIKDYYPKSKFWGRYESVIVFFKIGVINEALIFINEASSFKL